MHTPTRLVSNDNNPNIHSVKLGKYNWVAGLSAFSIIFLLLAMLGNGEHPHPYNRPTFEHGKCSNQINIYIVN